MTNRLKSFFPNEAHKPSDRVKVKYILSVIESRERDDEDDPEDGEVRKPTPRTSDDDWHSICLVEPAADREEVLNHYTDDILEYLYSEGLPINAKNILDWFRSVYEIHEFRFSVNYKKKLEDLLRGQNPSLNQ